MASQNIATGGAHQQNGRWFHFGPFRQNYYQVIVQQMYLESFRQLNDRPIRQLIDQPNDRPIDRPIDQPIDNHGSTRETARQLAAKPSYEPIYWVVYQVIYRMLMATIATMLLALGVSSDDISSEGISLEGISLEGISLEGISSEGISLEAISLEAISIEDISSEGSNISLWVHAYNLIHQREAELMKSYIQVLDVLFTDSSLPTTGDLLNVHCVKSILCNLSSIREKKEIQLSFPTDIELLEELERLAKLLFPSDMVVKTTANAEPHTALAWSGVSLFISHLANGSDYNMHVLKIFSAVSNMQMFWRAFEEIYLTSSHSRSYADLREPLAELYSYIIEYQTRAICYISKPSVRRMSFCVAGIDEMMRPIRMVENKCLEYVTEWHRAEINRNPKYQLQTNPRQVSLEEEYSQIIEKNTPDEVEQKLLSQLTQVAGDYKAYKDSNPERFHGTCEWFLMDKRFCDWLESENSTILFVSAGPGCGKSVLSKSLIDECHLIPKTTITFQPPGIITSQRSMVICYFFFQEDTGDRMDGAQALSAILHQLFQHPLTSNLIKTALPPDTVHRETLTQFHTIHQETRKSLMEELWQIFVKCAKSSSTGITCILDALDECTDSAVDLLEKIDELYSDGSLQSLKLKFFITGRPYVHLKSSFKELPRFSRHIHFDGDEKFEQISEDIQAVIDANVQKIGASVSTQDRDTISKQLKSMENRTYLWLHHTLEAVKKASTGFKVEDIETFLPSALADVYERILSRSKDTRKVEALLQIVLATTRPLALDEAKCAHLLALKEEGPTPEAHTNLRIKPWEQDRFKWDVQYLCGLFISIHDSKLSFIHQTARDFLTHQEKTGAWKGRLNLSKSHGVLTRACIRYLKILDPSRLYSKHELPLLSYAANSWFLHFRSQDAESTEDPELRESARELCRLSDSRTEMWLECMSQKSTFDGCGWTDLHFACWLGLAAVVYDIIVNERADVNMKGANVNQTPLNTAIEQGHLQVMEILLHPTHGAKVDEHNVVTAACHRSKAKEIMTLLLDKRGKEIEITEFVLTNVVANKECGAAVLALLLERSVNGFTITKDVIRFAVEFGSAESISLLLEKRDPKIKITEKVMKAATQNTKDIISVLIKRQPNEAKITEAVLMKAMKDSEYETFDIILDNSTEINITESMVIAVVEGSDGPMRLRSLLQKRGCEILITEDIIKTAVRNIDCGLELISLLLDHGHRISISEDIIKAAIHNPRYGFGIMSLLLEKHGREIIITDDTIMMAKERKDKKDEMLTLLRRNKMIR